MVGAVVYATDGEPVRWWPLSVLWLGLLALLGFLQVSTWRYYSFKGINLSKAYSPLIIILVGALRMVLGGVREPRSFATLTAAL